MNSNWKKDTGKKTGKWVDATGKRIYNIGAKRHFIKNAKGYPFVRYHVTNKPLLLAKMKNA